jgi:hypothetical protein
MEKTIDWVNIMASIYIALPIVVTVVLMVLYLIGKAVSKEAIDKLLEFGKWYMVAVAIVFFGKLLDSSFTDRETSIKEIAIYEKYATNIMETDSIEKRWKLIEYFAAVTPSEQLRERWEAYKTIIKPEYDTLLALKKRQSEILSSAKALTPALKTELLSIQEKKNALNVSLISSSSTAENYVIVFAADTNLLQAQFDNNKLKKAGITDAIIVNVGKIFFNISKEYISKGEASSMLDVFRSKVRGDVYITSSGKFCKNKINKGDYFSCE